MIVNPSIKLMTARSWLPFSCELGITSSATTKIIAPAAKANASGSNGAINATAKNPITAEIGSTIPEN